MSAEFTVSFQLAVTKGSFTDRFYLSGQQYDQTTQGCSSGIWAVGTSEENLSIGDIATNGFIILHNLDSTNYVDYGLNDSGTMKAIGRIKAGELVFLRLKPGATLRAQANTASVNVEYRLYND